jgi:hypothetical protein
LLFEDLSHLLRIDPNGVARMSEAISGPLALMHLRVAALMRATSP